MLNLPKYLEARLKAIEKWSTLFVADVMTEHDFRPKNADMSDLTKQLIEKLSTCIQDSYNEGRADVVRELGEKIEKKLYTEEREDMGFNPAFHEVQALLTSRINDK